LCSVSTYFGKGRGKQAQQIATHSKLVFEISNNRTQSTGSHCSPKTRSKRLKSLQFRTIMNNSRHFHAFMAHLGREYSMEGLLAIVEFTQYQSYAVANFADYLSSKYDYKADIVELPPDIPKSLIVYGSNGKSPPSPCVVRIQGMPSVLGPVCVPRMQSTPNTPNAAITPSEQRYNYKNTGNLHSVSLNLSPCVPSPIGMSSFGNQKGGESPAMNHQRRQSPKRSKGLYADLMPFQTKATLLYEKYIAPGSEFEINISYGLRSAFTKMLADDKIWCTVFEQSGRNRNKLRNEKIISENLHRILKLFKESVDAMIKLCAQSFGRFKREYAANLEKYM